MKILVESLRRLYQSGKITIEKLEETLVSGKVNYEEYSYIIEQGGRTDGNDL